MERPQSSLFIYTGSGPSDPTVKSSKPGRHASSETLDLLDLAVLGLQKIIFYSFSPSLEFGLVTLVHKDICEVRH